MNSHTPELFRKMTVKQSNVAVRLTGIQAVGSRFVPRSWSRLRCDGRSSGLGGAVTGPHVTP